MNHALEVASRIQQLDFAEAHQLIKQWLAEEPASLRGRMTLGQLLMMEEKYTAAQEVFLSLLNSDPDSPSFHIHLAQTLSYLKNNAQASKHYLIALKLAPDNTYYQKLLERHYLANQQLTEAIAIYQKRLTKDPIELNSLLSCATLVEKTDKKMSLSMLQKADQHWGKHFARPSLYLGGFYARANNSYATEKYFSQALTFELESEIRKEKRSHTISPFPCLDNLYQGGLICLNRRRELNDSLKNSTTRLSNQMYDARMFQDLVSMDSIYLEFGHEDALDYFFDRPENNHWLPDSNEAKQFMAAVLPANEQTDRDSLSDLSWARLNRKRKYQEVIESYHNSQSPLSPLSLAQLAIAARDSNQLELCQQLMEQFVNQPNSTPENNLLHFFSATVLLSSSLDSAKIESRKTIEWCNVFSSNITEKAGNYTSLQKLLQSWYLLQSKKFTDSNIDYHNYLSLDPTLDFSFLLYRLTGWFVMR